MKKQVLFILLFALCATFISNAQSAHSSIMFKHHTTLNTPEVASIAIFHPTLAQVGYSEMNVGGEISSRRYENAERKRNAGIALTAIGGTFLIGGSALMAVGVTGLNNDIRYGATSNGLLGSSAISHSVEVVFGTIFLIAGTATTIPGAIILAKSSHDMKKYKDSQSVN
ncbi:MAG: hypothetical protein JWO03_3963 [Bacteroidetes bacterium]|nr:hypothetical protein [Bacteroidota bacterium]